MDVKARLVELAKIGRAPSPVVSVYLNTRWSDEHQRDRVRVFVKNEVRHARENARAPELAADLDWVEERAAALIDQTEAADAHGAALFACAPLGLRDVLPLRTPLEDVFVVGDRPHLRPLADALEAFPALVVVFVDGGSARLVPADVERAGEEVVLEAGVPGRHRRGGWALMAESRYRRHIEAHRGRHFEAVAQALADLAERGGARRIVVAGRPEAIAELRAHLPRPVGDRVIATMTGTRHESASALARRAAALAAEVERSETTAALDDVLTEASKNGRAVAGLRPTLDAVARGAVRRLFLLKTFREVGVACRHCGALAVGWAAVCPVCGRDVATVELGEAMVDRVLGTGGTVDTLADHEGLGDRGGVAALLRYPL